MELIMRKFGPGDVISEDAELRELIKAFKNQLNEARDTLADIRGDPDGDYPTLATLYFSLATDPQGPRAALEAALTQRGLVDRIIYISRDGLRHMYLAWRDYVENGEVTDQREVDGIYDGFKARAGLPYWDD
jgi:hypothetical protein